MAESSSNSTKKKHRHNHSNHRKDNQNSKTSGSAKPTQKSDIFSKVQEPPYEDYWSREKISDGLKRGQLIQGTLRINQRDYQAAYVDDPDGGPDYFIPEPWARNRALNDDQVVIQIMPIDKWEPIGQIPKSNDGEERLFNEILSSLKLVDSKGTTPVPTDTPPNADHTHNTNPTSNTLPETGSVSANSIDQSNDSQLIDNGTNNGISPIVDTPITESVPVEDTPTQPTLIDALYTSNVDKKTVKRDQTKSTNVLMKDGVDLRKYKRTAKVVCIINKGHSRACAGTVKVFDKVKGVSLFSPSDNRLPRVIVPLSNLPDDYTKNPSKYQNTLFICRILEWANESLFPSGQLLRSLGEAGEIEPETACVLTEYQIDDDEFPHEVLECLPKLGEDNKWITPEEEIKKRRDFRKDCVVSIDPSTARDLDDALHCKEISPGVYEVGVHIADVSHFITPGSPLDKMAADRATSVYLVQRVIPMLPRQLCEHLCSLNPHEEKLTFSVVWQLTLKGELLNEWMGKSIICSRAKLSYEEAQQMIDNPENDNWTLTDFPNVADQKTIPNVAKSVVTLNKLAKLLRFLRQNRGTLRLDQPKLCFSLDKATGLPNGCHAYQHKESNKLIEEFMLLANMAVAQKISKSFPNLSLLRRHPSPKAQAIEGLRDQCKVIGVVLDLSSAGNLQKSLSQFSIHRSGDETVGLMEKQLLTNLCCKIMELARYFCTGSIEEENYLHYALNVPKYTHFTSPIRRYPDVIVHRLLAAALDQGPRVTAMTEDIEEQAQHCNKKRRNAKTVEEFSGSLFLGVFIRECGPLSYPGIVQAILNKSFDVYIPQLAIIKRIYLEKLPLSEHKFNPSSAGKESSIVLVWKQEEVGNNKRNQVQTLKVFTPVVAVLSNRNKTLQFDATLAPPSD